MLIVLCVKLEHSFSPNSFN